MNNECQNCGECCGVILATNAEIVTIKHYISKMPNKYRQILKRQKKGMLSCCYRDDTRKRCAIHEVRPEICRAYGHLESLHCDKFFSADESQAPQRNKDRRLLPNML